MLKRIIIGSVISLTFSSAAYAGCNCHNQNGTAYNVSQQSGVKVLRGNIPSMRNAQNTLNSQRKAAEKRAETAERRARIATLRAAKARAELAARPAPHSHNYGYRSRSSSPYFSGSYGYGASISRGRGYGRRGFGSKRRFGGGQGISRPVFTRGIRG